MFVGVKIKPAKWALLKKNGRKDNRPKGNQRMKLKTGSRSLFPLLE